MPSKNAARHHLLSASVVLSLLLLLGSAVPLAHAQQPPTSQAQNQPFKQTCIITNTIITPEQCITSTFPLMAVGLLLSVMIIAVVYMLGEVFNYEKLKGWYRAELWEVIKSLIVVISVISALVIMSGIAAALAGFQPAQQGGSTSALGQNLNNLYSVDTMYLGQQLNNSYSSYASMLGVSMSIGLLKEFTVSLWAPLPPIVSPIGVIGAMHFGFNANIYKTNVLSSSGDSPAWAFTGDMTNLVVVPSVTIFQVQYDLFYYIVAAGLGILIPIGIVFRAIPLLRGIGGTVLGIGIGLALIYPSILALFNLPVSNYMPVLNTQSAQLSATQTPACPFSSTLLCSAWNSVISLWNAVSSTGQVAATQAVGMSAGEPFIAFAFGTGVASNSILLQNFGGGFASGFSSALGSGGIYPVLNFVTDSTLISILQFILFAIDLLIGLIITGALVNMLGGQLKLGIGQFRLT